MKPLSILCVGDVPPVPDLLAFKPVIKKNYQKNFGGMAHHLSMMQRYFLKQNNLPIDRFDYICSSNDLEGYETDKGSLIVLPSISLRSRPWDKTWTENVVDLSVLDSIVLKKQREEYVLLTETLFGFTSEMYGRYKGIVHEYRVDHRVLLLGNWKEILKATGLSEGEIDNLGDLEYNFVEERLLDWLYDMFFSKMDGLIVFNQRNYDDWTSRGFPKNKIKKMLLPLDSLLKEKSEDLLPEIQQKIKNVRAEVTFGYIGRISKDKNIDFLIKVWEEVWKLNPNARLIVAGEGADEKLLQERLEDKNLVFLGKVPHAQVYALAEKALDYAIVSTSIIDTFNKGAAEVMSKGVKLIVGNDSVLYQNFAKYPGLLEPFDEQIDAEGNASKLIEKLIQKGKPSKKIKHDISQKTEKLLNPEKHYSEMLKFLLQFRPM